MISRTIIFDIDGLVAYPDFNRGVVRPMEKTGVGIKFWTFSPERTGMDRLRKYGLGGYANPNSLIGENFYRSELANTIAYYDLDKRANRLPGRETEYLMKMSYFLARLGLPNQESDIQRAIQKHIEYEELTRKLGIAVGCKYPPLLGDGNYLLVESDCSEYISTGEYAPLHRDKRLPQSDKKLATEAGYSIIIVPEYPDVWEAKVTSAPPELVVKRLREMLLQWNGEHIVKDLGEEMGVYQEGIRRSPERE